jgi:hypothetical protein
MGSVIYEPRVDLALSASGSGLSWDVDDQLLLDPIDNSGLERLTGVNNTDKYLFCDVNLIVTAGYSSTYAAGQWVELYMICEELDQDGTNYEDGDAAIEPPAANYIGAFQFVAGQASRQSHILRQIPIPPLMFKFLLINKADLTSDYSFAARVYRYKTT